MNVTEVEKYSEDDYREMLDDVYGDINICGFTYSASYALETLDPIAFNCGFVDSQEYVYECGKCGGLYKDEDEAEDCCKEEED